VLSVADVTSSTIEQSNNKHKIPMLQRIQSIYLLFAGLVIFALFLFPLAHNVYINSVPSTIKVTGIFQDVNGQQAHTQTFVAMIAGTAVVAILPLILIFIYKNRRRQMMLCYGYIFVVIGFSYWLSQAVQSVIDTSAIKFDNFGIGIFLSPISIALTLIAAKAIQRDEKLVRSADRLR
jgi:hypothetical protein